MTPDAQALWRPLGSAGGTPVVDTMSRQDYVHLPKQTPRAQRCDLDVQGLRVNLSWRERVLVAALVDDDGTEHDVARCRDVDQAGRWSVVWHYALLPLQVLEDPIDVAREPSGRDRWAWAVGGPDGRAWQWRPAGRILADRMELTRSGESRPAVTHQLRPVPAHPRSPAGPPTVSWDERASLAEILLPVMWVLQHAYEDLLPKQQRALRADFL